MWSVKMTRTVRHCVEAKPPFRIGLSLGRDRGIGLHIIAGDRLPGWLVLQIAEHVQRKGLCSFVECRPSELSKAVERGLPAAYASLLSVAAPARCRVQIRRCSMGNWCSQVLHITGQKVACVSAHALTFAALLLISVPRDSALYEPRISRQNIDGRESWRPIRRRYARFPFGGLSEFTAPNPYTAMVQT